MKRILLAGVVLWMGTKAMSGVVEWRPLHTYEDDKGAPAAAQCERHRAQLQPQYLQSTFMCMPEGMHPR